MKKYNHNFTAIVKPVNDLCNLSCEYCYADTPNQNSRKIMTTKTLKATIDYFCHLQDDVEFIWHGGEPMLAGLNFYMQVVKLQQKWIEKGIKITNFIQTNATLMDKEWASFFRNNNFLVGVSLDGPPKIHNRYRKDKNGNGTFNDVMQGIELLCKFNIFNGIICCVSNFSHSNPEKLFDFFITNNIKKLKFARIKKIGGFNKSISTISAQQYYDFMIKIFELWINLDDTEVEIRDIQSVVSKILGGNKSECIYSGQCGDYVTVYNNGQIFTCDSFSPIKSLHFGNVSDNRLISHNMNYIKFVQLLKQRKKECSKCKWFYLCNSGCSYDNYSKITDTTADKIICEPKILYFEHISRRLKNYGLINP